MTFLERINAVLHGRVPDRVPFAPYDNLVPRGEFAREMCNRGMGLCLRRNMIWQETPNVAVEQRMEGDTQVVTWHTPVGSVSTRRRTHLGRISDGESLQTEWMIKDEKDYAPVIFMIRDTVFHADANAYHNHARDVGNDGIVRGSGLVPPYQASYRYFGLINWAFHQRDYPSQFASLLEALDEQQERLFTLVKDSPAEFISFGTLSGQYGTREFAQHDLPFYQRYVPKLKEAGKICAIHAHNSNLRPFKDLLADTGVQVIEAYTPPPISDLPLDEARAAWGEGTVIWVNFPESIFWERGRSTLEYTRKLLRSDTHPSALVIGMTEMGTYGITDPETERAFKQGIRDIMDVIGEFALR